LKALVPIAQRAGPYLLIELVMPGGTLLALLLYLHRQRQAGGLLGGLALPARCEPARDGLEAIAAMPARCVCDARAC
jgi:hypothetical protein